MKIFYQIKSAILLFIVVSVFSTSCNKLELNPTPNTPATQGTTPTLATLLDDPNYSLLKSLVTKAGMMPAFATPTLRFTLFAPDDAAIVASLGVPDVATAAGYLSTFDAATAASIVQYHTLPQVITTGSIPASFPNFEYPSLLNPAPSVSPLLRLSTFPSISANGAWVNNVPIIGPNNMAVNGVLHKMLRIVMPPSQDLWTKIKNDTTLTYFFAAINRADSGVAPGSRIQDALNTGVNPSALGANLTIFAPDDAAMKTFLVGAIAQAFIAGGMPPAQALAQANGLVSYYGINLISNPGAISGQLAANINPTLVKGVIVYHIISAQATPFAPPGIRVFSVNFPSTASNVKTLLNSGGGAYALHPGVTLQATFFNLAPGVSIAAAATVKGLANSTASNLISMDNHCINGVLHKIDQVLIPQ